MLKRCIAIFLLLVIICTASAFVRMPAWATYTSPWITLRNSTLNNSWWNNVLQATSNWNAARTNAIISISSSTGNMVYASSYGDESYGEYVPLTYTSAGTTKFEIRLNSTTINRDATNFDNFVTSTMAHEIGHSLGIHDRPGVSTCIMGLARNRNTLTTPQTDDINGVNDVWPVWP